MMWLEERPGMQAQQLAMRRPGSRLSGSTSAAAVAAAAAPPACLVPLQGSCTGSRTAEEAVVSRVLP